MKNLPVLKLTAGEERRCYEGESSPLAEKIAWFRAQSEAERLVLALEGLADPSYSQLKSAAAAIADAWEASMPPDAPVLVLVERDMAKALGFALRGRTARPVLAVDGIRAGQDDYVDFGRPLMTAWSFPRWSRRCCLDDLSPVWRAGEEIVEKRGGRPGRPPPKGRGAESVPPLGGEERRRSVRLSTTLFGQTFQFSSIKEVLAKANEEKSGDVLAGIAAASGLERIAAKEVLSNLLVSDLRENPVVPYEDDEVTRIIQDGVDPAVYQRIGGGPSPSCGSTSSATTPRRRTSRPSAGGSPPRSSPAYASS